MEVDGADADMAAPKDKTTPSVVRSVLIETATETFLISPSDTTAMDALRTTSSENGEIPAPAVLDAAKGRRYNIALVRPTSIETAPSEAVKPAQEMAKVEDVPMVVGEAQTTLSADPAAAPTSIASADAPTTISDVLPVATATPAAESARVATPGNEWLAPTPSILEAGHAPLGEPTVATGSSGPVILPEVATTAEMAESDAPTAKPADAIKSTPASPDPAAAPKTSSAPRNGLSAKPAYEIVEVLARDLGEDRLVFAPEGINVLGEEVVQEDGRAVRSGWQIEARRWTWA
jgi:hypothetical protein